MQFPLCAMQLLKSVAHAKIEAQLGCHLHHEMDHLLTAPKAQIITLQQLLQEPE